MAELFDAGRAGARRSGFAADSPLSTKHFPHRQWRTHDAGAGGIGTEHRVLGSTVDDAAGECFDKTGKLMGLPYPAGRKLTGCEQGNPKAYDFPRPLLNDPGDDFSFSGLKTSVRIFSAITGILDDAQRLRDMCASIQARLSKYS